MIDDIDLKILEILQRDCTVPLAEVAAMVGLSATPCWRRIQKLEEEGYIRARVALLDPRLMNVEVTAFVSVRTNRHTLDWFAQFEKIVANMPEVMDFFRLSGDVDYLLRVALPDIKAYDAFYKRLIAMIDLSDVSCSFAMETIKSTTELPLRYLEVKRR